MAAEYKFHNATWIAGYFFYRCREITRRSEWYSKYLRSHTKSHNFNLLYSLLKFENSNLFSGSYDTSKTVMHRVGLGWINSTTKASDLPLCESKIKIIPQDYSVVSREYINDVRIGSKHGWDRRMCGLRFITLGLYCLLKHYCPCDK